MGRDQPETDSSRPARPGPVTLWPVRLLRRSAPSTTDTAGSDDRPGQAEPVRVAGGTAGKGRPTPKRRDAARGGAGRVRVAGGTAGRGRPTPKRRDAGGRRRGPAPAPPRTQREASKLARANRPDKEQRREQRMRETEKRRVGIAKGDDR